jgi:hypothetical protein
MTANNGAVMTEQPPSPSITPSPGFRRASLSVASFVGFASAAAAYRESNDGDGGFSAVAAPPLAVIQRSALFFATKDLLLARRVARGASFSR